MTEVVVAGSRLVDPKLILRKGLEAFIVKNASCTFRLRRGVETPAGPLERAVADFCESFEVNYSWWTPETRLQVGRKAVWYRDTEMVSGADLVLCYYLENQIGSDDSGTVSLVDKALGMGVPVYAYGQTGESIIRVGEYDLLDLWGDLVPRAAILAG